jgi:MFS-type transporter involved in bile tolerance (Atg22 family)
MGNIVLNAALLELAQRAAGCPTGEELLAIKEATATGGEESYACTNKIYGQNPLALISNIAVITGLLSAFFMPIIGVILDFASYRRFIGVAFSVVFTLIQIIQISIGPKTWFAMAILQSIGGFCFAGMIMTSLAYLPEICEVVGQEKHSKYTARFSAKQFTVQALFLILVGGLSFAFGIADNSTLTARMAQGFNAFFISILFGVGWHYYMPSRPASRSLPGGLRSCTSIVVYGLKQNIRTAKSIFHQYKKGLLWFLVAEVFAQSSVGALTTLSVVYLSDVVGLNATDVSLFFLVVLMGTIPGARLAPVVTKRFNPNVAWQISMVCLFITIVIGAFTLGSTPNKYFSLIWGFFVGFVLGW